MQKGKGIKLFVIILFCSLVLAGGGFLVYYLTANNVPDPSQWNQNKLSTPTGVAFNNSTKVLSYNAVTEAVAYTVYVNDTKIITTGTSVDLSAYINEYKHYDFMVEARHKYPSLSSSLSSSVGYDNTMTLTTPQNFSWDSISLIAGWSQVTMADNYQISICYDGVTQENYITDGIYYDFTEIIAQNTDVLRFDISVLATSRNSAYVHNSSSTQILTYYRMAELETPNLVLNFNESSQMNDTRLISWNVDRSANTYVLWLDNIKVKTFNVSEIVEDTITVNLNNYATGGMLGEHSVYVVAVPVSNINQTLTSKASDTLIYKVFYTLNSPTNVKVQKSGNYLAVSWDNNDINSAYYQVTLYASEDDDVASRNYYPFEPKLVNGTLWTISLDECTQYHIFNAEVIACYYTSYEYICNSAPSVRDASSDYYAITKMETPKNVTCTGTNGIYEISWTPNPDAVSGYIVNVYDSASTTQVVQVTMNSNINISTYMNAKNLLPGEYFYSVSTAGNNTFYIASEPSERKSFNYKVKLATPEVLLETMDGNSPPTFALSWAVVNNAQSYDVYLEGRSTPSFNVLQPVEATATRVDASEQINAEFSGYAAGLYKIQVRAKSGDENFVDSLFSSVVSAAYTQKCGNVALGDIITSGNNVSISWNSVLNAVYYRIMVETVENDEIITSSARGEDNLEMGDSHTIDFDLTNYLVPGVNRISVFARGSLNYYEESDAEMVTYEYHYDASVLPDPTITVSPEFNSENVLQFRLDVSGIKFVDCFGISFSNGENSGNLIVESGHSVSYLASITELPPFSDTTITINATTVNANYNGFFTPKTIVKDYMNTSYMPAPTNIYFHLDNLEISFSLDNASLNYIKRIAWEMRGSTSASGSIENTVENPLTEYVVFDVSEIIDTAGEYVIYLTAIGVESANINSATVDYDFDLMRRLQPVENLIIDTNQSTLQWDLVDPNAESFTVQISKLGIGLIDTASGIQDKGETRYGESSQRIKIIRYPISQILLVNGTGTYKFSVIANSSDEYWQDSDKSDVNTIFDRRLDSPEIIGVNNVYSKLYLQINPVHNAKKYLVEQATLGINSSLSGTMIDGYLSFEITQFTSTTDAGIYKFIVTAQDNPTAQYKYDDSVPAEYDYAYQTAFSSPSGVEYQQTFSPAQLSFSWNSVSASVNNNGISETLYANKYHLIIKPSYAEAIYETDYLPLNPSSERQNFELPTEILNNMESIRYSFIISAVARDNKLDSTTSYLSFNFEEQLDAPVMKIRSSTLNYLEVIDGEYNGQPAIAFEKTNTVPNSNKMDVQIVNLSNNDEVLLSGLSMSANTLSLTTTTFTQATAYQVKFRHSRNGSKAQSDWSNVLYVYNAQSIPGVTNIGLTKFEQDYTLKFTQETGAIYDLHINHDTDSVSQFDWAYSDMGWTFQKAEFDENWTIPNSEYYITIDSKTSETAVSGVTGDAPTNYNFTPGVQTLKTIKIGQINPPTNYEYEFVGNTLNLTWEGDAQYSGQSYFYRYYTIDAEGNSTKASGVTYTNKISGTTGENPLAPWTEITTNSCNLDIIDNSDQVLAVYFYIYATLGSATCTVDTQKFVRTQTIIPGDVTLQYNSGTYRASWTNVIPAGISGSYTLNISGTDITGRIQNSNNTRYINISSSVINEIQATMTDRYASCTLSLGDMNKSFVSGDPLLTYKGGSKVSNALMPYYISQAPDSVTYYNGLVTWSPVDYATKYTVSLYSYYSFAGEALYKDTVSGTNLNIGEWLSGRFGSYKVRVQVAEDLENKIYSSSSYTESNSFYCRRPLDSVTSVGYSEAYSETAYTEKTLAWNYSNDEYDFQLTIYDSNNREMHKSSITPNSTTGLNYNEITSLYTYSGFVSIMNTLPGGEYLISIVVLSNGGYFTNSIATTLNITNNFVLNHLEMAPFVVVPDFYMSNGEYEADLTSYENNIGTINEKYLVINDSTASYTPSYKVYVNDILVTDNWQNNALSNLHFDSFIAFDNKLLINFDKIMPGRNKITLVPNANGTYYKYHNGTELVACTTEDAITALSSEFFFDLTLRFATPKFNNHASLGYSDSNNENLISAKLYFENANLGGTYRINVYYKDLYNGGATENFTMSDMILDESYFDASGIFVGIDVFNVIQHLGPHQFYFTAQRIATISETGWLSSNISINSPSFTLKSKISGINNVTASENGELSFTLPMQPYSARVDYEVTMSDVNVSPANIAKYAVTLNIAVSNDGAINYNLINKDGTDYVAGLFEINTDLNIIVFDMKTFFEDETRSNYYLAGNYKYKITGSAKDKNGATRNGIISNPTSYPITDYNTISYTVGYPCNFSNVVVDENGDLSWEYEDLLGLNNNQFIVTITTDNETDVVLEVNSLTYTLPILDYLVGGGAERNRVTICAKAPNNYYINSAPITADLTRLQDFVMPNFSMNWISQSVLNWNTDNNDSQLDIAQLLQKDRAGVGGVYFGIYLARSNIDLGETANYDTVYNNENVVILPVINNQSQLRIDYLNSGDYSADLTTLISSVFPPATSSLWLDSNEEGYSLISGFYYLKLTMECSTGNYLASSNFGAKYVRPVWRDIGRAQTLTGEFLTLEGEEPVNNNDYSWSNALNKEAILPLTVNIINNKIPNKVKVIVTEFLQENYNLDNQYIIEYNLSGLQGMNEGAIEDGKITRSLYSVTALWDKFAVITINLEDFFNTNQYAGVYRIQYQLLNDDNGGESGIYTMPVGINHYTVIPKPILNYRLSYIYDKPDSNNEYGDYAFVIDWSLTAGANNVVNNSVDYKINILSFPQLADGSFCGAENMGTAQDFQAQLVALCKTYEAQGASSVLNYNYDDVEGRIAYKQNTSLTLQGGIKFDANKTYYVVMFFSSKDNGGNAKFYKNSETSVGVSYTYVKVSREHFMPDIQTNGTYPLNEAVDDDMVYYSLRSTLRDVSILSNNYNCNYELFVYNSLYGSTITEETEWWKDSEAVLSHLIIGTLDNKMYPSNNKLYLKSYNANTGELTLVNNIEIGEAVSSGILINNLALSELLSNGEFINPSFGTKKYTQIGVDYFIGIKTWLNNYLVNKNGYSDGVFDSEKYSFLDLNSYCPISYFTFAHTIQFQAPSIAENGIVIENINDEIDYLDGYITSTATINYQYKIKLDNTYTTDVRERTDKKINLIVKYTDQLTGSIKTAGGDYNNKDITVYIFDIIYDDIEQTAYIILNMDTEASLFALLANNLPNELNMKVQAVQMGTAVEGSCFTINNENTTSTRVPLVRNWSASVISSIERSIIVRKQFATPALSIMLDGLGNGLIETSVDSSNFHYTNLLGSKGNEYACSPYLFVDNYDALLSHEYSQLASTGARYEFTFTDVATDRQSVLCLTAQEVHNTLIGFVNALNNASGTDAEKRYNYDTKIEQELYSNTYLYSYLLDFINPNASSGVDATGGQITLTVKALANNSNAINNYWVDSEISALDQIFDFYLRADTAKVNLINTVFTSSDTYITDTNYYHHSEINISWNAGALGKDYDIVLSQKDNLNNTTRSFTYTYANSQKNGDLHANIASILSNSGEFAKDAWNLSGVNDDNSYGTWYINVQGTVGDGQFMAKGYPSNTVYYGVKLKLINKMKATINSGTQGTGLNRTINPVTAQTNNTGNPMALKVKCFINSQPAANQLKYTDFSFINDDSDAILGTGSIDSVIANSITKYFTAENKIGQKYILRFAFSVGDNGNSNIYDSDPTEEVVYYHYRYTNFNASQVKLNQSEDKIVAQALYDINSGIGEMTLSLNQTNIYTSTSSSNSVSTGTSNSCNFAFTPSRADCLSDTVYANYDATVSKMLYQGHTANIGSIQAGFNYFTLTAVPANNDIAKYNILHGNPSFDAMVEFHVPSRYGPDLSIDYTYEDCIKDLGAIYSGTQTEEWVGDTIASRTGFLCYDVPKEGAAYFSATNCVFENRFTQDGKAPKDYTIEEDYAFNVEINIEKQTSGEPADYVIKGKATATCKNGFAGFMDKKNDELNVNKTTQYEKTIKASGPIEVGRAHVQFQFSINITSGFYDLLPKTIYQLQVKVTGSVNKPDYFVPTDKNFNITLNTTYDWGSVYMFADGGIEEGEDTKTLDVGVWFIPLIDLLPGDLNQGVILSGADWRSLDKVIEHNIWFQIRKSQTSITFNYVLPPNTYIPDETS